MLISIVRIGNSKGIRLPKAVLEQCEIEDQVDMEIKDKEIILRPVRRIPRAGWAAEFKAMAEKGDDELLVADSIGLDSGNWDW
jgi:antitoxin MazE